MFLSFPMDASIRMIRLAAFLRASVFVVSVIIFAAPAFVVITND
jgi:hypothetical protein